MATSLDITFRLYLRGDNLVPAHVSCALGLEPTGAQQKGLPFNSRNPTRLAKFGVWSFARDAMAEQYHLVNFLHDIEAAVQRAGCQLLDVEGVEEAWVDVYMLQTAGALDDLSDCELQIGLPEINMLKALDLHIDVTFGVVGE